MKKTNKISKIALRQDLRKVYRTKDNAFKAYQSKDEVNACNYLDISQASACDKIITILLENKSNINNLYAYAVKFVAENNVIMKNYNDNKALILKRVKRHLTSDNINRLSKRAIVLT